MRKLFFLLLALPVIGYAQIYTPVTPTVYGEKVNRIKPLKVLHMPERDSVTSSLETTDSTAQIFYNREDSSVWIYTKYTGFVKITSSGGLSQTLQQVFDVQSARAVMNKNDTIDVSGGPYKFVFKANDVWDEVVRVTKDNENYTMLGAGWMQLHHFDFADLSFYAKARLSSAQAKKVALGYDTLGQSAVGGGGHAYLELQDSAAVFVIESSGGGGIVDAFFAPNFARQPGNVFLGYGGHGRVTVYGTGSPNPFNDDDATLRKFNVFGTSYFSDSVITTIPSGRMVFSNSGNALDGDAGLTYNTTSNTLTMQDPTLDSRIEVFNSSGTKTVFLDGSSIGKVETGYYRITEQVSNPSSPPANTQYIFARDDGKLYRKKSDGTVIEIAGGTPYTTMAQFVDETAWRNFYSNGSGDMTAQAFGADNTVWKSTGASSAPEWAQVKLNEIDAANNTSDIDNGNNTIRWRWETLNGVGMDIFSTSTSVTGSSALFQVRQQGAHPGSNAITYSGYFSNFHTGTGSKNVSVYAYSASGDFNYAIIVPENGGNVGFGVSLPDQKAILELKSTTQGFLTPRMTNTERNAISSPPTGLIIYSTTDNQPQYYNGSAWTAMSGGGGGGYTNLTSFVDQTAWRAFYSNGSGDVVEQAFGADNTVWKSTGASSAPEWANVKLNELDPMDGSSTIDNGNRQLQWKFDGLDAGAGMTFSSNSTASTLSNTRVVKVSATGTWSTSSQSSVALYVENLHDGTGASSFGIWSNVPSNANNMALVGDGSGAATGVYASSGSTGYSLRTVGGRASLEAGFAYTSVATITSGSSSTVGNTITRVLFNPSSVIASYTLTMPASPIDGQIVQIEAGDDIAAGAEVVTSLTVNPNSGQTIYGPVTLTSLSGGDAPMYQYDLANLVWKRLK